MQKDFQQDKITAFIVESPSPMCAVVSCVVCLLCFCMCVWTHFFYVYIYFSSIYMSSYMLLCFCVCGGWQVDLASEAVGLFATSTADTLRDADRVCAAITTTFWTRFGHHNGVGMCISDRKIGVWAQQGAYGWRALIYWTLYNENTEQNVPFDRACQPHVTREPFSLSIIENLTT